MTAALDDNGVDRTAHQQTSTARAPRRWTALIVCFVVGLAVCALPAPAATAAYDELPAFPGAEGFGYAATGGRGGEVYHVTSKNLTGAGTFHDALTTAGDTPRTIVFEVGGTITIPQIIVRDKSKITIAGQTAPGDGVTIKGNNVRFVDCSDIVIRHLRFRMGKQEDLSDDSMYVEDSQDVIIDHSSFSWGTDEVLSVKSKEYDEPESKNITVQWSIMSEGLLTHSMGGLIEMNTISMHHNLYAHNNDRNPKTKGVLDFVNNTVYNWGQYPFVAGGESGTKGYGNMVGNYFIAGVNSSDPEYAVVRGNENYQVYLDDNKIDSDKDGELDGTDTGKGMVEADRPAVVVPDRFEYPPVHTQTPDRAHQHVLDHAGASVTRDGVDRRVIAGVRAQTGAIIGDESDVGGYPELDPGTPPADTDRDGMPDEWEQTNGLDPRDAEDRNGDADGDRYTNLEEYLNELAAPTFPDGYPMTPAEWTGEPFEPPVQPDPEPEPESLPVINGELARNVVINDTSDNGQENAANWSLQTDLQTGDRVAGDRTGYTFTSIPEGLQGSEWIRSAVESRGSTATDLVTFHAPADVDLYVAHDSRIAEIPAWLEEYEPTGQTITDSQSVTFDLYTRRVTAGTEVVMGANNDSSKMNYFVVLRPAAADVTPPSGSPDGLAAEVTDDLAVSVQWEPVADATNHLIYRSSILDPQFRAIGSSPTGAFTDADAVPGISYAYQVSAVNGGGESASSAAVQAVAHDPAEPRPAAPRRLQVAESHSYSVDLEWQPVDAAVGYAVFRSERGRPDFERVGTALSASFTDESAKPSHRYRYRVTTLSAGGESRRSRPVGATTHGPLQDPVAAKQLSVEATGGRSFSLAWSPVKDAETYSVYRRADGEDAFTVIDSSATNTYVDDSPSASETGYSYRVTAQNELGESEPSAVQQIATPLPPQPDGFTATLTGSTFVGLTWTSPEGASEYHIYRARAGEPAKQIGVAKVTSFYDRTARPGTEYTYVVKGSNAAGESAASNAVTVTTPS